MLLKEHNDGLRGLCERGGRKIIRAKYGGWPQGKSVTETQQYRYTYELIETIVVHIRPAKVQAKQSSILKRQKWTWVSNPHQEASFS